MAPNPDEYNRPEQENGKNNHKEQENSKEKIDYDKLLSAAGDFGIYQGLLTLATCPFFIFGAWSYFSQMFMTQASTSYWCAVPELANLTILERRSLAIPNDTGSRYGYSQCTSYIANWSEVLASGKRPDSTWMTESCQHGWEFNKTEVPYATISSEMGWVCEKDSYQARAQSVYFLGSLVGGLLFGWTADRYGRVPTAVYSNLIGVVAGVASVFTKDFIQFTICRFIMGMSYDSCMIMAYILLAEYVGPKHRAFIANAPLGIFFSVGLVSLPWISLACGHWKTISLATSIPMTLALLTPFILPESPRWLLSKGRVEKTIENVLTIARVNKKVIPLKVIENFKTNANEQQEEKGSIIDLLKRPSLRIMFICACILYMCNMIAFDALVRSLETLDFDIFVSFTLVSITEAPALLINAVIVDWTGRKWLNVVGLLLCGTLSILTVLVPSGWPSLLCAVLARFAVNMSATAAMQWSLEVLPTPVRGTGSSIIHIFGYIGTIISPFIAYLSVLKIWLPMVVIGAISYLGAATSLKLPETARKEMPQTFDDAERLIHDSNILEFPCKKKNVVLNEGRTNDSFDLNEI